MFQSNKNSGSIDLEREKWKLAFIAISHDYHLYGFLSLLATILGRNINMAVVYSNTEGFIKYLGDQMFVDIIADKCEDDLLNSSAWEDGDAPKTIERVVLPYLPAPVSRLNAKDMQHIIPNVMRNLRGGGYVKWGKADSKPIWWPEDVVFANVKQRPEQQKSG